MILIVSTLKYVQILFVCQQGSQDGHLRRQSFPIKSALFESSLTLELIFSSIIFLYSTPTHIGETFKNWGSTYFNWFQELFSHLRDLSDSCRAETCNCMGWSLERMLLQGKQICLFLGLTLWLTFHLSILTLERRQNGFVGQSNFVSHPQSPSSL